MRDVKEEVKIRKDSAINFVSQLSYEPRQLSDFLLYVFLYIGADVKPLLLTHFSRECKTC